MVRLSVLVDFVTQALQMLKEHPTYRDDEEIRGMYLFFRVRRQRGPVVDSTSYFQPDIPRASHILNTGWICFIVILSPFQALRWLGRHERVLKMQKWQGWKKGKGMPCLSLVLSQFLSFFFFMFALSQFSGPDYLGACNWLSHPEFQILGHACKENNAQLATFYLLGFFNPFKVIILYYWYLFQITVFGWRACKLAREDKCTSTINKTFTFFTIY